MGGIRMNEQADRAQAPVTEELRADVVRCRDCRFWDRGAGTLPNLGHCLAHPPQLLVEPEGAALVNFPTTDAGDGCAHGVRRVFPRVSEERDELEQAVLGLGAEVESLDALVLGLEASIKRWGRGLAEALATYLADDRGPVEPLRVWIRMIRDETAEDPEAQS